MMKQDTPEIASLLFKCTIIITMFGVFFSIFFFFTDQELSYRIAAAVLVGVIGIISFLRHSVFYRSDQARMQWHQEHPEFQIEVGFANLAMGVVALLASLLNWGSLACGMALLVYALYLLCSLGLHVYQMVYDSEMKKRAQKSVLNTGIFVIILLVFAFLAINGAYPLSVNVT